MLDRIGLPRRISPVIVVDLGPERPARGEVLVRIEPAGVCRPGLSVVDGDGVRPAPMLLDHLHHV